MTSRTHFLSRQLCWTSRVAAGAAGLALALSSQVSFADEGGVSFWLPGIFGSLAAVPLSPGLTVTETYYHWQGQAGADVAAAREITIGRFNPTLTVNLSGSRLGRLASSSLARGARLSRRETGQEQAEQAQPKCRRA